ncbi:hypothetical protein [Flavobacterium columnare]|uniref:HNH endonuclease n=1 Tax=Flavobacterium columnare TaxID=996 RepID=A0AAI8CGC3_9FLAO|nr:hypothetical protein [Flavobacterium columnare]AMO19442.1 hypothetical protein UN65_02965 [Flavobacterium columnare]AUX17385.1 hypothetical protein AQ623_03050 [Flavobacterium columnare]QOG56409.1 hypothetical protein HUE29_03010 [Flavobacterium columnare]QOG59134.1 hypothetical protein HUE30_03015 [Flavobacterium columnare]QOG61854.1 hypothetical protein HUE31_03015 [Flavobacterium columnare]
MHKINYPEDIEGFKEEYYSLISEKFENEKIQDLDNLIIRIDGDWSFKKLLTATFSELISFSELFGNNKNLDDKNHINREFIKNYDAVEKYNKLTKEQKKQSNRVEKKYRYTELRNEIVAFLREKDVNIKSCFYCNIEYVNNFEETFSFKNEEEFLNDAPEVFLKNSDLPDIIVNKIIEDRSKGYLTFKEFLFSKEQIKKIEKYCIDNQNEILKVYNEHYALDHVIGKAEHPYLSLSIFNLVPCCSSCNSKFKHTKEFKIDAILTKIIPSSEQYALNDLIEFRLKDLQDFLSKKDKNDLTVELTNLKRKGKENDSIDKYLSIFKLKGRYESHKEKADDIIKKRENYSETQINEMSKLLSISSNQIKKDIFGKECFETNNEPFEKYKQDIAKQIGLFLLSNDSSKCKGN